MKYHYMTLSAVEKIHGSGNQKTEVKKLHLPFITSNDRIKNFVFLIPTTLCPTRIKIWSPEKKLLPEN